MDTTTLTELVRSSAWVQGPPPAIAVHVATFRRPGFLPELIDHLERQTLDPDRFEVVVVDNGSGDETWSTLLDAVHRSSLRLAVGRIEDNRGPAAARNAAVAASRADVLAFTDDDCLPSPRWLAELLAAAGSAEVVQGRTEPDPAGRGHGAWARTIRIVAPTPLFETCNIAYRRDAFDAAGGFDEDNVVSARPGGRAFGEDVLLGAAVVRAGGRRAFAPDALVHHRYLPASFADHVRAMAQLEGFPALAGESEVLAAALWQRTFLTARTAAFDLALVSCVVAALRRRPLLLLGTLPWIRATLPMTRVHGGRPAAVRLVQLAVADAAGAAALLRGSVRHRRPVL